MKFWDKEYPHIKPIEDNLSIIQSSGYKIIDHFILPKKAWLKNYYIPLETTLKVMTEQYKDNLDAQKLFQSLYTEINIYRRYSDFYGYVFYIMQRKD